MDSRPQPTRERKGEGEGRGEMREVREGVKYVWDGLCKARGEE